jgi:hypothetical protein
MGLLGKIFTGKAAPAPQAETQPPPFVASDLDDEEEARLQQRRDTVQRILRDTMQQHGIPSDWIDCRIVQGDSPGRTKGLHVQLIVRRGQDRLLTYIFAFQESFRSEFARAEPRAEWLHSLAWEFVDTGLGGRATPMPPASAWAGAAAGTAAATASAAGFASTASGEDQERMAQVPLGAAAQSAAAAAADAQAMDDLEADLQALYAIRDAALKQPSASSGDDPDFEPTRPAEPF